MVYSKAIRDILKLEEGSTVSSLLGTVIWYSKEYIRGSRKEYILKISIKDKSTTEAIVVNLSQRMVSWDTINWVIDNLAANRDKSVVLWCGNLKIRRRKLGQQKYLYAHHGSKFGLNQRSSRNIFMGSIQNVTLEEFLKSIFQAPSPVIPAKKVARLTVQIPDTSCLPKEGYVQRNGVYWNVWVRDESNFVPYYKGQISSMSHNVVHVTLVNISKGDIERHFQLGVMITFLAVLDLVYGGDGVLYHHIRVGEAYTPQLSSSSQKKKFFK